MICDDMWGFDGIYLMGFDGFLHRAFTCCKKNQNICEKHVRFGLDLEGCNFIVPKNCSGQGLQFYRGGAVQKDSTRQRHAKAL